jgi:hypothetical protein
MCGSAVPAPQCKEKTMSVPGSSGSRPGFIPTQAQGAVAGQTQPEAPLDGKGSGGSQSLAKEHLDSKSLTTRQVEHMAKPKTAIIGRASFNEAETRLLNDSFALLPALMAKREPDGAKGYRADLVQAIGDVVEKLADSTIDRAHVASRVFMELALVAADIKPVGSAQAHEKSVHLLEAAFAAVDSNRLLRSSDLLKTALTSYKEPGPVLEAWMLRHVDPVLAASAASLAMVCLVDTAATAGASSRWCDDGCASLVRTIHEPVTWALERSSASADLGVPDLSGVHALNKEARSIEGMVKALVNTAPTATPEQLAQLCAGYVRGFGTSLQSDKKFLEHWIGVLMNPAMEKLNTKNPEDHRRLAAMMVGCQRGVLSTSLPKLANGAGGAESDALREATRQFMLSVADGLTDPFDPAQKDVRKLMFARIIDGTLGAPAMVASSMSSSSSSTLSSSQTTSSSS